MQTPRIVRLQDVTPSPWKNGGGQTRELSAWPEGAPWRLRVSVAEIGSDGPFSSFSGITRWIAVVAGKGVVLRFGSEERRLSMGSPPLRFDGAWSPGCRLIDGPTLDLNLMIADGRGTMTTAYSAKPWAERFAQRGLFARAAGRWVPEKGEPVGLMPNSLLWHTEAEPGAWRFEPESAAPEGTPVGWWLGYTPEEIRVSR
ncbi:MAG TPA: HutD family protein [Thermoanaerobaculia bacterium]|nr:HutD family protein [Thermoanaerobaculia bacterium]